MFERFERDARRAVLRAGEEEDEALASASVEAEHLLLALAAADAEPAGRLLVEMGLAHDEILGALEREAEHSLAAVGVALSDFASARPVPGRGLDDLVAVTEHGVSCGASEVAAEVLGDLRDGEVD